MIKLKIHNLYDTFVKILLVWCVLQDFVLCILLRITGLVPIIKVLFYSKDVILLILCIAVLLTKRIPAIYLICSFVYFGIVFVQTFVGWLNLSIDFTSLLSSIRGLVLLPTLTLIGYGVRNRKNFDDFIKKYYKLLFVVAIFGLFDFFADILIGTKSFWMNTLQLDNYYIQIKGSSAGLENGTPGNWYTDIGKGYRTQKRLISIWMAPLTAGFVLLLPSMYYFFCCVKGEKNKSSIKKGNVRLVALIFMASLVLTFTRQTILPFLGIALIVFIHYRNYYNKRLIIIGILVFLMFAIVALGEPIYNYIYNGSTMVHLIRIQGALEKINFWGLGVGTFGTRFFGAIATESQYLTLIGQLGVISIVPYMYFLIKPIIFCLKRAKYEDEEMKTMIYSICFCGITYVFSGLASETVAAFTSIAQYYIIIGYLWGYCKARRK